MQMPGCRPATLCYLLSAYMNCLEEEIYEALRALETTVEANRSAPVKTSLLPFFARLDALQAQLPPGHDPALHHYLQRKSYEKARLHLEGRSSENPPGNCRR
jgi:hypothetical protein